MDYLIGFYIMVMLQPMALLLGYFIGDPIWRCKILNKLMRGFYGIVILDGWGNNAMMMTKNLKKDLLQINDDVYAIDGRMIKNIKTSDGKKIKDEDISVIGGVPFIELNKDTMIPIEKSTMKLSEKYRNMLPGKVGATLKTEVAIARAKAYNEQGETMKKILLVLLVVAIISAGIAALTYMQLGNLGTLAQQIYNNTATTTTLLNATG